ncbi:MAG: hypothetical protein JXR83_12805 [Deltaproteobacteria bacterium]|nr:hypothetical protein [Deltaproteobacteria bacterium]
MSRHRRSGGEPGGIRLGLAFSVLALVGAGCGPAPEPLLCGPDTVLEDGACVSILKPTTCGAGTTLDQASGECRPDVFCAAGTTYDAVARVCVPTASCGPGTELDPDTGLCLPLYECGEGTRYDPASHQCLPIAECGSGTHLDEVSGECIPDDRCGEGTTYHPVSHLCVPDLSCGPGLVAHEGVCLTEAQIAAAGADTTETLPDYNDPALGGTPEELTLEPIGESTVFVGTIDRPVDRDGDDEPDQDRDFWSFTGRSGQLLRLRVIDNGLPRPGFRVQGPEGYERTSKLGVVITPNRLLLLPRDGTYIVEVGPTSVLAGEETLIGGADHGYVGVIEELPWPELAPLGAPLLPEQAFVAGSLFDLSNNFFLLQSEARAGLLLNASSRGLDTVPSLLVFSTVNGFVQEVELKRETDGFAQVHGLWAETENSLIAVLDWTTSNGLDASFDLSAALMPQQDAGAVAPASSQGLPQILIPGRFGTAISAEVAGGQIVTAHLNGLSQPLVTLAGPSGVVATMTSLDAGSLHFYAPAAGRYTIVAVNSSTSDVQLIPGFTSTTPLDAGAFANGSQPPVRFDGDALYPGRRLPDRAWIKVENTAPLVLEFSFDYLQGMPDFDVYRASPAGALVGRNRTGEDDLQLLRVLRDEPGLSFALLDPIALDPPNPAVLDWSVSIRARDLPAFGDVEPNDLAPLATDLGALPAHLRGTIEDDAIDVYRLDPGSPLAAGEALQVQVTNLTGSTAIQLRIHDASFAELHAHSATDVSAWTLLPDDGPGPFYVELEGTGSAPYDYALEVTRVSLPTEVEPNDDFASSQVLDLDSDLSADLYGRTALNQPDVLFVNLPRALSPQQALRIRAENLQNLRDLYLRIYDAGQAALGTTKHEDGVLLFSAPAAGPLFVEIEGSSASSEDLYRLQIRPLAPVEIEPNNNFVSATPLPVSGGGPAHIWGLELRGYSDFYRVEPDTPLAAGECHLVRWRNSLERGDILVTLYDAAGTPLLSHEYYSSEMVYLPDDPAASFYVEVMPVGYGSDVRPELYQLEVERALALPEREPNQTVAEPQLLPLGALLRGQSRSDDLDTFAVILEQDLGVGQALQVQVSSLLRLKNLALTVRDEAGQILAQGRDVDLTLQAVPPGASAGSAILIEVVSDVTGSGEWGLYSLQASIVSL